MNKCFLCGNVCWDCPVKDFHVQISNCWIRKHRNVCVNRVLPSESSHPAVIDRRWYRFTVHHWQCDIGFWLAGFPNGVHKICNLNAFFFPLSIFVSSFHSFSLSAINAAVALSSHYSVISGHKTSLYFYRINFTTSTFKCIKSDLTTIKWAISFGNFCLARFLSGSGYVLICCCLKRSHYADNRL